VYEYYYDDQYEDDEYYDDDPPPPRRKYNRKHRPPGGYREDDDYYEGRRDNSRGEGSRGDSRGDGRTRGDNSRGENSRGESSYGENQRGRDSSSRRDNSRDEHSRDENSRGDSSRGDNERDGDARGDNFRGESSKEVKPMLRVSGPAAGTVYDRPRVPPKIRRPVPINERDKYDYTQKTTDDAPLPTQDPKKTSKSTTKHEEDEEEYYDDEYEDDYYKPPPKKSKSDSDYSSESSGKGEPRRSNGRHRPRQHSRRRPDRYEDEYEEDRPVRPRKRPRYEDPPPMTRGNRGGHRGYSRDEPDPVPAERPGFISSGRSSPSSRQKTEEERSQSSNKKQPSRVVYDDEEDEEEYYDEEEDEDISESEANKKYNKPSGQSGRRNDDYEAESEKKSYNTNSKPPSSFQPSKSNFKSNERISSAVDSTKSENVKPANRQKSETSTSNTEELNIQCKNNCGDSYPDDSDPNKEPKQGRRKENERDNQKESNERDRIFSSRFRETSTDLKTKQQSYEPTSPGRVSALPNYRTVQSTEPPQRSKPSIRVKSTTEETTQKETTTTNLPEDYSDESSTSNNKYSNFRSKGRVVPPTPLVNNYKTSTTTYQPYDTIEDVKVKQDPKPETYYETHNNGPADDKALVLPRPFSGMMRRPIKPVTEPTIPTEEALPAQKPTLLGPNYRQPASVSEDDYSTGITKTISPTQNYRRVKTDPPQVENNEYAHPKLPNIGSSFRKPSKAIEDYRSEEYPVKQNNQQYASNPEDDQRKAENPYFNEKGQLSAFNNGGLYRRVKVSAISTQAPEPEVSTSTYITREPPQDTSVSNPVNNYKRPYLVARPLSNFPVVVEDTTKPPLGAFRRPTKQKLPNTEPAPVEEYNPTTNTGGIGQTYHKDDQNLGISLRPGLPYYTKKGKLRINENSATGLEQYPKQLTLLQEGQFSKQSPKIEITAPGPSAPDVDIATVKSNYKNDYNNAQPGFALDIPEEEYDVTLNDALQPSTLHPTRSLVDYQQTRLKTREYQARPDYVSRGRVSYLVPSASQQYVTRVQSVTARYTDKPRKEEQEEYEAIVMTASSDQWADQQRNRPTEWYW